jgi:hypothetical protein
MTAGPVVGAGVGVEDLGAAPQETERKSTAARTELRVERGELRVCLKEVSGVFPILNS